METLKGKLIFKTKNVKSAEKILKSFASNSSLNDIKYFDEVIGPQFGTYEKLNKRSKKVLVADIELFAEGYPSVEDIIEELKTYKEFTVNFPDYE